MLSAHTVDMCLVCGTTILCRNYAAGLVALCTVYTYSAYYNTSSTMDGIYILLQCIYFYNSVCSPPKVNSAVIKLVRNNRLDFDAKTLKRVVKAGFGKRRKTLRNALKELNLPDTLTAQEVFNKRAEQLSVQDFIDLTAKIEKAWKK